MAQFQCSQPLEGSSTTKPPFFDGTNYNYWKNGMKVFMLANVPKAWIVTMKGPYVPMKVVGKSEVPKEEVECNDENLVKIMINNKAINMLQCALNPTKFHRVSGCDTAKEMWDMLEVLRSLPKNWEAKKTAIEESKDLNTLKLEDLIGKLMTYEIEIQVDGGVEAVKKKKKNVAFKASNQKEESEDDASNDESSNEEDITKLISKEVKRFMKKNIKSKLAKRDEGESTKRSVKCYECNKMGHYRNECPKLKKEHRALQWIISRILAQRKGSKSVVLSGDLLWFDYLLKRKRLNLGRFIYRNLIKTYSSNMGLAYGALITRLVKRNNVDLTPFMLGKVQSGTTLNKASFENMQYEFRNGS
ncbi:hypothetical protein SLEP1_g27571 [Rubroshorea leprosula]|uniref:CCHC-type domain-containing protein n=1 Tax=Rubroshorea leprosula TaxID=152421 RepID=A0AAV5K261_9ROSI|nr:hypothetical protein SLEP1_g27571 [Rubroshorea leprosula]